MARRSPASPWHGMNLVGSKRLYVPSFIWTTRISRSSSSTIARQMRPVRFWTGWLASTHASGSSTSRSCQRTGSERTMRCTWAPRRLPGALLLFRAADVVFEPTTLRRAVALIEQEGLDHLAALPDVRVPGLALNAFVVASSSSSTHARGRHGTGAAGTTLGSAPST